MEALKEMGLAHDIGVSNYSLSHMEDVLTQANIPPAVNQIECNPFSYDKKLIDFCQKNGVIIEAYSPLTRGLHLDHATVVTLAVQYGKSPAQILLRWALQKGAVVIPKSSNPARIAENADIFSFSIDADGMRRLDALAR
jgi:diketogulonate reductase-like aldo/keto reductase